MIFRAFCIWASALVLTSCSTDSTDSTIDLTNEPPQRASKLVKKYGSTDESPSTTARDRAKNQSNHSSEMNFGLKGESSHSVSDEDISKIREIENYYKRVSTGDHLEQPDPKEILKHRIFLTKIFNRVTMTKNPDGRLRSTLRELLSTITTIAGHNSLNSSAHSAPPFEANGYQSKNGLLFYDTAEKVNDRPADLHNESPHLDSLLKNSFVPPERYNSKLPFSSGSNQLTLKSPDENDAKNSSSVDRTISSSTISKRYGELSGGSSLYSPFSLSHPNSAPLRHQSSLERVYQSPTLASSLLSQHNRGAMNQGMLHLISQSVRNPENITESPLAITDSAALEEDISNKLLELLIQANNQGGSALNYNTLLENALAQLTQTPQQAVNINVPTFAKPVGTVPLGNNTGLVAGVSPEVLASLLVRLQLPTTNELTQLKNQLSNLVKLVGEDTRLETVNTTALSDILMNISDAIITIITSIAAICQARPLVCVLAAVALCALIYHIYKKKHGKKKYTYKDSGYGHDSGGYHRRNLYDYDAYRRLDEDTQAEVTSDILGKIDVFDDWIKSVKDFQ